MIIEDNMQRILVSLFTFIWWKRLEENPPQGYPRRAYVVKVKSWRTAIIDSYGQGRSTRTFMIKIGKWYL